VVHHIYADYAFGKILFSNLKTQVEKNGGTVVGFVAHPLGTMDFSSHMLQAQASKADVVAIANGGDDAINAVKAAREFGLIQGGQKIVPTGLDALPAIKSAGLELTQGLMYVTAWAPGINSEADRFMKDFIARRKTAPGTFHVGTYSAVRAYLKAVAQANSDDPKTVIAKMRETRVKDAFTDDGVLRPDGRMVHDVYLVQIKSPAESKGEWDLIRTVETLPGDKVSARWAREDARSWPNGGRFLPRSAGAPVICVSSFKQLGKLWSG
jgi:branched-chain amino acid transport system substrate-binding protein